MIHEMSPLATREGSRRDQNVSWRSCRQPLTTSYPSLSLSTSRGMSAGSFWPSPSMVTTSAPRARSKPAASAAVWPKFARSRTTRSARELDREVAEARARRVRRAVVDDDQLVRPAEAFHDVPQARQEGPDVVLLVVDGDDDRERDGASDRALACPAARRSPRVRLRALR